MDDSRWVKTLHRKMVKKWRKCEWCHKIRLCCDAENIASRKIAESNKYKLEGFLRQDAKWPDGTLRDKLYFGKLKSDIVKS